MKKTANIWEYKCGINDIVANFVFMWKYRIRQVLLYQDGVSHSMDPFRSALLSQHTRASHWIGLFARCSTKERGIPLKAMCSTVSRLLSDKSSSWSDGRLANVPYFNTWKIKHNLHGISSFCEQPLATGKENFPVLRCWGTRKLSVEVFANNATLMMLIHLLILYFDLEKIISCVWDTWVF